MDRKLAKKIIRAIGTENGYIVSGKLGDDRFDVYIDRNKHGIAFQVRHSCHSSADEGGWLQIHHYEGEPEE